MRVPLDGGWSIEVPGELARERNDDRTWTAWDRTRTVWFQALRFTKPGGTPPNATEAAEVGRKSLPDGDPLPPLVRDGLRGEAVFGPVEEDGRTLWRLSGVTGCCWSVSGVQRVRRERSRPRLGRANVALAAAREELALRR